ncbi:MAG: proline dehydrogenase family protein [Flavobacteriales bacterium]|nr:proline dehydrogenase family protein [Flavobacteriales bacterium]
MTDQKKSIFDNLETAFSGKTNADLKFSAFIFQMMSNPFLVKLSTSAALLAVKLHLPITGIVKTTVFKQFCGGESQEESKVVIDKLGQSNVKSILDYSVEGENEESHFEKTTQEILKVIRLGKSNANVPVACIKITGIGSFDILEKVNTGVQLSKEDTIAFDTIKNRLNQLCLAAQQNDVPLYIDAEESWIQDAIDSLSMEMMFKYNAKKAYVFNTIQMYRWDRLDFLKKSLEQTKNNNVKLGVKIVRGAYIEKENKRALEKECKTPIQQSKQATDNDYNAALVFAIDNIDAIEFCAGTHNEHSSELLTQLMKEKNVAKNHPHIYFSQLFGMSDQISFNLASLGYNVSKYVPYGPVKSTLPYLIRRAEENTSMAGQIGKELLLIKEELKRRKMLAN